MGCSLVHLCTRPVEQTEKKTIFKWPLCKVCADTAKGHTHGFTIFMNLRRRQRSSFCLDRRGAHRVASTARLPFSFLLSVAPGTGRVGRNGEPAGTVCGHPLQKPGSPHGSFLVSKEHNVYRLPVGKQLRH